VRHGPIELNRELVDKRRRNSGEGRQGIPSVPRQDITGGSDAWSFIEPESEREGRRNPKEGGEQSECSG